MRALLSSFSSIINYSHRNQAFHHTVRDHPVFPFMVINTQPESAILFGFYQEIPWPETCKNIVGENGSFSQHRHFLYDKFLSNNKSLQIYKR